MMHAFTVPKAKGGERFICHPRALTLQKTKTDASSEGLSMAELIRLLNLHLGGRKDIFILESDFTNFFPQMSIPPHLRPYFGLWVCGVACLLNSICARGREKYEGDGFRFMLRVVDGFAYKGKAKEEDPKGLKLQPWEVKERLIGLSTSTGTTQLLIKAQHRRMD